MLKKLIEYSSTMKEEMKITLSEIKKNLQGINSRRDEAGIQINNLEYKEEISIQPEQQKEKKEFKKMRIGLGTSGTTLNVPTSQS